eukprot:gene11788-5125_t
METSEDLKNLQTNVQFLEEKRKKSIEELQNLWREKQLFLESRNLSEDMKDYFTSNEKDEIFQFEPYPIDFKSYDNILNGTTESGFSKEESILQEIDPSLKNTPEYLELLKLLKLKKSM